MAIEPPARFAVIGAGPIGLEAALYARYLGFDVAIYEQGEICEHVRRWSHVELITPFRETSTSLGRQALRAQADAAIDLPGPDEFLTGGEWIERYLLPLANSDLLAGQIRTGLRVTDVSRLTYVKTDLEGGPDFGEDEERRDEPLRVLAVDANGVESVDYFDAVIDASGVLSQPLGIGPGGAPAIGERAVETRIGRVVPRDEELSTLRSGARSLLIGTEFSAARTIALLAQVAARDPDFRCVWIARGGPEGLRPDDPQTPFLDDLRDVDSPRRAIVAKANELARSSPWLTFLRDVGVEEIHAGEADRLDVRFLGRGGLPEGFDERQSFDRVTAHVGYRPDLSPTRECQIHYLLSEGPPGGDPVQAESDLYVIGAKASGRLTGFRAQLGREQIRKVFALVGERPNLDLYARAAKEEGPGWDEGSPG